MEARITEHPILGQVKETARVTITVDGNKISAKQGEPIIAALIAAGIKINRYTAKKNQPRGLFCGIGQCTDCAMVVDGVANVRTCITPVKEGMVVATQTGRALGREQNGNG